MSSSESVSSKIAVAVKVVQASTPASSLAITFSGPEEPISTWFEMEASTHYQKVGIWFEHPSDSNPHEIRNIAIVNESLTLTSPNPVSGMFTRISLQVDSPSLETLNDLGGCISFPPTPLQKAVFGRISELMELAAEDEISISPASFWDLWGFISSSPEIRPPSVFALDNGNFRTDWKNPEGELIGIEFCGDQLVKFVIFGYAHIIGKMMRIAGSQPIGQIRGHVEAACAAHLLRN